MIRRKIDLLKSLENKNNRLMRYGTKLERSQKQRFGKMYNKSLDNKIKTYNTLEKIQKRIGKTYDN